MRRPRAIRPAGFFARVYAIVRRVPAGRVVTYAEVARALDVPRGARAVGWALRALSAAESERIPWHRVVGHGGRISPRDGSGMAEQRERLLAEGVAFSGERVDLTRHSLTARRGQSTSRGGGSPSRSRARRSR